MLEKTGVPEEFELSSAIPSKERMAKGPVAVIECFQEIPCNPCSKACKTGAIKPMKDINERPQIDFDKCTGCGLCMTYCPGLAIFIVDDTYSDEESLIKIPYELLPLPEEGSFVTGLDREGKPACRAKVVKVQTSKMQDRTAIVSLAVPKELSMKVRFLRLDDYYSDNTIICRCEEVTLGEIREYIRKGYVSLDEIKRISRAGMGPCQGRTCRELIMGEISKACGKHISELNMPRFRPPVKPVKLGFFLGGDGDE